MCVEYEVFYFWIHARKGECKNHVWFTKTTNYNFKLKSILKKKSISLENVQTYQKSILHCGH